MDERNQWIDIITKLYRDLHTSPRVMHTASESDKKRDRVLNYFERLERVHNKVSSSKDKSAEQMLKKFYYDLYVIKPENIPDSYFEHEKQIMRERGYGNIEITPERKGILVNQIIEDQRESLDKWIEYFLYDEESKHYEMWEKYWVFQGLQGLGKYDKEKGKFSKRDKHTVYPFPPVDREAVFTTLKLMEDYIKDKKGEDEIRAALGSGNFKTLYEYSIKMIMQKGEKQNNSTDGVWIKYNQGSDYNKLRDSLQGYYTGWCTAAGENFAKGQLANGDFYVYYTYDENNEPKVPRIAIRMNGHNEIGEIRGIADNQNMEPEMLPILNKKLEEFPDKDKYLKKEYDMQLLTTIDNKVRKGYELTSDELRFLYEIDDKIEGFGNGKDPRIEEIKSKRNIIEDLNKVFAVINSCKGSLNLSGLTSAKGLILPQSVEGDLDLSALTSAEGLILPQRVEGDLDLRGLTSAEGLILPQSVGKDFYLNGLTSTKGLILPQNIGGSLVLNSLTSAKGLNLPKRIGGYLVLVSLTSAEDLILPENIIAKGLNLMGLTSAKGLILPQQDMWYLDLSGLTSTEGLILPQHRITHLDLSGLTSAEGLTLPKEVDLSLRLNGLRSAKGLKLPKDFLLDRLWVSGEVKAEILANPELYYQTDVLDSKKGKEPESAQDYESLQEGIAPEVLTLSEEENDKVDKREIEINNIATSLTSNLNTPIERATELVNDSMLRDSETIKTTSESKNQHKLILENNLDRIAELEADIKNRYNSLNNKARVFAEGFNVPIVDIIADNYDSYKASIADLESVKTQLLEANKLKEARNNEKNEADKLARDENLNATTEKEKKFSDYVEEVKSILSNLETSTGNYDISNLTDEEVLEVYDSIKNSPSMKDRLECAKAKVHIRANVQTDELETVKENGEGHTR